LRRVLRQAEPVGAPRVLIAPSAADDPTLRAILAQEVDAAYQRGRTEGEVAGRMATEAESQRIAQALRAAVETANELAAATEAALAARLRDLAVEVATAVVGELPEEQLNLVTRVTEAIEALDDRPLTVLVNPGNVDLVNAARVLDVEVVGDPLLGPGEARIHGRFGDADLTWQAVWHAVREALDVT